MKNSDHENERGRAKVQRQCVGNVPRILVQVSGSKMMSGDDTLADRGERPQCLRRCLGISSRWLFCESESERAKDSAAAGVTHASRLNEYQPSVCVVEQLIWPCTLHRGHISTGHKRVSRQRLCPGVYHE